LALVGVYLFDHHIFEAVNNIKPSWRNELEITDAIQYLIDNKFEVRSSIIKGWWKDTGKPEDILEANRILLGDLEKKIEGEVDSHSQVIGQVVIEEGAEIIKSTIRGPAIIGKEAKIHSSYVGPFTSIGDRVFLDNAEVEHSIIMENTTIAYVENKIEDSIIGKNAKIIKSNLKPKAYRFLLGDTSQVGIL
jgi:glucose-1-phosphate thymidylyltransferase